MGSEDCVEPLPKGWILQRNAKGEVIQQLH